MSAVSESLRPAADLTGQKEVFLPDLISKECEETSWVPCRHNTWHSGKSPQPWGSLGCTVHTAETTWNLGHPGSGGAEGPEVGLGSVEEGVSSLETGLRPWLWAALRFLGVGDRKEREPGDSSLQRLKPKKTS